MFTNQTILLHDNLAQFHYGVAVTDLDGDGAFELFVAGSGCRNRALKWNGTGFVDIASEMLADETRRAIGVAAGDIDGDGREELYVLNADTFSGRKQTRDRLFDARASGWQDLCALPENRHVLNLHSGRSVACIDRNGDGRYGFLIANHGARLLLYELEARSHLRDVASNAQLDLPAGGRGLVCLPLISEHMDIFAVNEHSPNFLFRNRGDGTFDEVGQIFGVSDPDQHGRGVTVLDANEDGRFDIVYGNWEGPHRLFIQAHMHGPFTDMAPPAMAAPSRVRTVIAADFDNDGHEEIFFNNIGEPNRLFGKRGGAWVALDMGDALEPSSLGTGAAVGDFDHDGRLELLISHGEADVQPLSLYHSPDYQHNWLRVLPFTLYGAPARGAVVTLVAGNRWQRRVIDAGSGYLCQMEPVAHFGLGEVERVERVIVRWPDGTIALLHQPALNTLLRVNYPSY